MTNKLQEALRVYANKVLNKAPSGLAHVDAHAFKAGYIAAKQESPRVPCEHIRGNQLYGFTPATIEGETFVRYLMVFQKDGAKAFVIRNGNGDENIIDLPDEELPTLIQSLEKSQ
ncbi:MAG: hypothetical protein COB36_11705 [Alphaproteobacteria bacterium]|nr:MAG: hypothetical protein COB36_11705 [Alphaproteobacteria bacterium]